ncbi:energy-coupling factor transporter transmembrane component T family protein [Gloeothece verrucosa]|uniref:Cobalt transport protein n=1 Tax=Gloeothece verrucosa (strain PCC 7822) TaxID=497965 RepID=E0UEB4_GLOV7|nr:energy-coupling factor transporter transmembrane component T [Gloeothece verrucosa]ADN14239.1 cobalt transport protein [Gloeothece verrucosa PCC 7822]
MGIANFQTVKRDSIFTRIDFRSKLVIMVTVTLIAFIWESPITGGFLTLTVVIACLLAGVKLDYLGTLLKIMLPFYLFLLLSMGFFNITQVKLLTHKQELTTLLTVPAHWWILGGAKMSVEGLLYGVNVMFKTLTMLLVIPLTIFTTDVNQMIVSLVKARIPYKIVFIFSSTLRFFPLLFDEIQAIIQAQRLRGLAFEKMGLLKRIRVYATVAVPLILNAMTKSQTLEVVLQSKAFSGSSQRTYLHESILSRTDYLIIGSCVGLFVLALIVYFWLGIGQFAWLIYPQQNL